MVLFNFYKGKLHGTAVIEYANSLDNSPDIIALTEITYKNKWHVDISELNIDGYRLFHHHHHHKRTD